MISVSFFVWNKESMFPIDKSWEKQKIYLWETWKKHIMCFSNFPFRNTLCVSMGKAFRNHKTCLEMGFSGGNTTQCQQWSHLSPVNSYTINSVHSSSLSLTQDGAHSWLRYWSPMVTWHSYLLHSYHLFTILHLFHHSIILTPIFGI